MRVCIERCKERAGPRHTILPPPPHYYVRGEGSVLVSGRKRPITAVDEPHARSSPSSDSSASTGSRLPRPCPASSIGLGDDVASAGNASGGRPAVPTTGGSRGAPAHDSNLVPAHASNNTTAHGNNIVPAHGNNIIPAHENYYSRAWQQIVAAHGNNIIPAHGNNNIPSYHAGPTAISWGTPT
jgi:hypothetical protein